MHNTFETEAASVKKLNRPDVKTANFASLLGAVLLLLLVCLRPALSQPQNVEKLRIWHSPDNTRIVFDVSASMEYKTFKLADPQRLVVDLEQANLSVKLPDVDAQNRHLITVRAGTPSPDVLRVVFDLKTDVNVNSFVLTPNELYGHRLVIDLTDIESSSKGIQGSGATAVDEIASGPDRSNDLSSDKPTALATENSPPTLITRPPENSKFIVAIDAGHGGDDPGAIGHRGTQEKKLTLSIARELQKRINRNPRMQAEMVRTGDYYIKLKDRRHKARELKADIFISIHADAFTKKSARGMSVFALSQRGATSTMASTLAAKENASDLIGGVNLADKDEVLAKVLVDLSMTNTISESVNLGGRVLQELGKLGRLHSRRVEQANFSVLRSPDKPSILVETGFITNPEEERRLRSKKHQVKLANAIYLAIDDYLEQTPYASRAVYDSPDIGGPTRGVTQQPVQYGRHKVVRGDSLSKIAQRYGISLNELKRLNKLKHNKALLGVRLRVPIGKSPVGSSRSVKSSSAKSAVHTVRSGDSLSKISARYNVTIRAIKRANGLSGNTLRKGQSLKIPGVNVATKKTEHKVKRGDTLSEIAEQYGSSVAKIKRANNLRSSRVQLGQVLKIPH